LYGSGQSVAWERLYPSGSQPIAAVPTYPWQRERYWLGDGADGVVPEPPTELVRQPAAVGVVPESTPIDPVVLQVSLHELLRTASGSERRRLLESYLRDEAAGQLGMMPALLNIESPLNNLGVDSLMAAELRTHIERDVGVVVPVVNLLDGPSVSALADWLNTTLSKPGMWRPDPQLAIELVTETAERASARIDLMSSRWIDLLTQIPDSSDDDVDALLREVLASQEDHDD
jgi:acyl transferase domain-containing protein